MKNNCQATFHLSRKIKVYLQKISDIHRLPIGLYKGGQLISSWNFPQEQSENIRQGYSVEQFSHHLMEAHIGAKYSACYLISEDRFLCGYLAADASAPLDCDTYYLIGPAVERTPAQDTVRSPFSVMESTVFSGIIDLLHTVLHPEHAQLPIHLTYKSQKDTYYYPALSAFSPDLTELQFSRQMLDIIRSGSIAGFHAFFDHQFSPDTFLGSQTGFDPVRSAKNNLIYSTALVSQAAMEGGVPQTIASHLARRYISLAESLTTYAQIILLNGEMLSEFCHLTAAHHIPKTDSFTVNNISRYVQEHLQEKIVIADIAAHLNLDPAYLSNHFRSKTGKTLTTYINEQKIREAQYLLDTSSLTLSEIANTLGYSSQQKFQNWFKRITGMTPMGYRCQHPPV